MVPNDKVVSGPLYLKFRKIPTPLALPFGWFPLQQEKKSQGVLLPSYGDGGNLGFFLKDLGYYVPIGDHWDAKLLADIYTGGSWAVRLGSSYNHRYRNKGGFNVSFQRQRQGFAGTPGFALANNFFVRWTHNQDQDDRPTAGFLHRSIGSSGISANLNNSQKSTEQHLSVNCSELEGYQSFSATVSASYEINGQRQLTVPSLSVNMRRTTLANWSGWTRGVTLLDNVVTYNSQMENSVEAPDSVFGALDFAS